MKKLLCVVFVSLFTIGCTSVDSGTSGVKVNWGKAQERALEPGGPYFYNPFTTSIVGVNTQLQSYEVSTQASSKDLQLVTTKISVQHSLIPSETPKIYAEIGGLEALDTNIIGPGVMEGLKAVTANYTAEELITQRDKVKLETEAAITEFINHTLKEKGIPGSVHISNIAIKDFDFSHEFNQSIEAKVKAQQEALRAQNEKLKRITEAEAAAREKELAADANAYEIEKMSIKRAEAIEREAKALQDNPKYVSLKAVEKWNGTVPKFTSGSNIVPFVNVDEVE